MPRFSCHFMRFASLWLVAASCTFAEDRVLHSFARQQLTDVYFSEGANAGDLNHDGQPDVVYGPHWYEGPTFSKGREIYPPVPQDREKYADNFFSWIYDFNRDGWHDVLVVGFPGTPAYVYENPKAEGFDKHWPKHQIFDWVSNESPQFVNLVGDEQPELVCTRDGFFGFVTFNAEQPFDAWEFHPVSEQVTANRFGHGLGIGDLNGDGRQDILHAQGWYEQPAENPGKSRWAPHEVRFGNAYGGAEMYAYDVDGDGDQDVITSLAAHDFGLSWFEQVKAENGPATFREHLIMGSHPSENRYGVLFSELHSVNLVDIDGDGLRDIVTGKTYYSHHRGSPMWDAGAVVYWFRLVRNQDGIDWIPYQADGEAGIGRQLSIADINGDKLPDIIVGGMKGAHVLTHQATKVDEAAWAKAQPKKYDGPAVPAVKGAKALRGARSPVDKGTNTVAGAIEGESIAQKVTGGVAKPQGMAGFPDRWSGNSQLWWTGARPGDKLICQLPEKKGKVDLQVVLTGARDYGIVQLFLDDKPIGEPIDLYQQAVTTTGILEFPQLDFTAGPHALVIQIVGANPKAVQAFMVGLDYIRLRGEGEKFPEPAGSILPKAADGRALNLDFETGTLADWKAEGKAFEGQPIAGDTVSVRRPDMRSNHVGKYWIGGFEKSQDQPQGTLTSVPFLVSQPFASFLTNGGDSQETRVELVRQDTGNVIFKVAGENDETMRQVVVDLRAHAGKEIFIRLVDASSGGWGHLNFDHFRLHDARPAPLTPPLLQLVADEYPHAGLNAEEAAKSMTVPPGFQVTVGAAEPDVKQPIAMALDDRGRVWIAEAYEYPIRAKGDRGRDRLLIFEDSDGDGKLDQRKVFMEGLNLVSGLEIGHGGVWIGAAPYLLFVPDRDGDDKPDAEPQILLDGWGYQDTHETLNAFIWGPDGWLYGCHGVFTHSRVGKPGTPDDQRIPLNAAIWRYHPVEHQFEVFAHGTSNPWGVDFNDHGQAFATACVIPHLFHIIQGARYQRQAGQHFNPFTYRDIVTIADHLHYLGANPHGGNNKSNEAGGGHAHAGAMVYLGGAWPATYRNQLFMNNIHGQRLNMDVLRPQGSGYVGGHGPDFLLTGDRASQILNLRYGPDGQAWMIDWYDMQACHRTEVEVHDRSNGRIYKIAYQGKDGGQPKAAPTQPAAAVNLAKLSNAELAELCLHPNDWYVRHSRRLLQERVAAGKALEPAVVERLKEIAVTHADDSRRLRALWTLHVTKSLDAELQLRALADASPYVRGWVIQLATERGAPSATEWAAKLADLARADESPVVRLYIASAAQRLPLEQRWEILAGLASHAADATDHNLPLMYWYAAEPLADLDPERALAFGLSVGEKFPLLREFMLRRIGSGDAAGSLAVLVRGLGKVTTPALQVTFLDAISAALRGQRRVDPPAEWGPLYGKLSTSENTDVRLRARALAVTFGDERAMGELRAMVADKSAAKEARRAALESLLGAKDAKLAPVLLALLGEADLRDLVLTGLAQYDQAETPAALLAVYPTLSPNEKRLALATLCSRGPFAIAMLRAMEQKQIPGSDLSADLVRQLQFLKSDEVASLLEKSWGTVRETAADKLKLIEKYKDLAAAKSPPADQQLGRAVFAKTCQKCHTLYGVGQKIGPDLTGSNRSNLDYLLSNIVDPSAVMAKEYQATIIATQDGRVLTGLVRMEDAKSVTLQTADALIIVPKSEIDERVASDKSMMPDDQLRPFTDHEIRSLIAYLSGKQQVPVLATADNVATLFNGVDLTGWSATAGLWSVESGEIVGRTPGLKRNEWLVSDLSADNFKLTVEVKLVGNEGNSGIQFRSQAVENGEVKGYQADVGVGWWGKLYEEHGRALLWDQSGEEHVKLGDWNTYEILAVGSKIQTRINGKLCVDLDDPAGSRRGIIALQLHSGGKTEVRYRNFQLELVKP